MRGEFFWELRGDPDFACKVRGERHTEALYVFFRSGGVKVEIWCLHNAAVVFLYKDVLFTLFDHLQCILCCLIQTLFLSVLLSLVILCHWYNFQLPVSATVNCPCPQGVIIENSQWWGKGQWGIFMISGGTKNAEDTMITLRLSPRHQQ